MEWDLVVDTGANAPFDVLLSDGDLTEEEVSVSKAIKKSWIDQKLYPMQSYSCIVLISKPIEKQTTKQSPSLF